ncbi:MAG: copper resistance protein CopC [Pseudohongiella sp.]|jgi:copper resistance protein C|nr:copper resistance protein CopC [Pseudohongiella sp.]
MKFSTAFRFLICAGFASLLSFSAQAHTALEMATPADGAVVKQGPAHINLVFNGPVKLVKLELMGVGHEMPTKFKPNAEAQAAFMIETPGMHPGQFTVNWAVIGDDGHTVASSYSFLVDPAAAEEHAGHDAEAGHGHGDANPH